jgi:hypothetical protein
MQNEALVARVQDDRASPRRDAIKNRPWAGGKGWVSDADASRYTYFSSRMCTITF